MYAADDWLYSESSAKLSRMRIVGRMEMKHAIPYMSNNGTKSHRQENLSRRPKERLLVTSACIVGKIGSLSLS